MSRFRGVRAVTSDRAPIIGRASGVDDVYLNVGHGSNGTTQACYAAEWLASLLCGEIGIAHEPIRALCDPSRFIERQRRRPNPFTAPARGRS